MKKTPEELAAGYGAEASESCSGGCGAIINAVLSLLAIEMERAFLAGYQARERAEKRESFTELPKEK